MRKKIAVMLPAMQIGGAEVVCLTFLEQLIKYHDVTVILNKVEGELLGRLPESITVLEDRLWGFNEIVKKDLKSFDLKNLISDFNYYFKIKIKRNDERNYHYLVSRTPKIKYVYDCAICYVANVSTQIFCLGDRIDAKVKIAWIHGETTELKDTDLFRTYYETFDKIYTVSEVTKKHFVDRFSSCESITDVYYNRIDKEQILQKSIQEINVDFEKHCTNIVTVGRLTSEKGVDMIPNIVDIIVKNGFSVHWYIVGSGPKQDCIINGMTWYGIEDKITLLGTKTNPYPYMKLCDIYVQPSYEEGYSTTICEAGILGKAIVGTSTSGGISEQLDDGVSGIIAEPNAESIAEKIQMLIINHELREKLQQNIVKKDFCHNNEIVKLNAFLDSCCGK